MKGYNDSRTHSAEHVKAERVFDEFNATESNRHDHDERTRKIALLKQKVQSGEYQADVQDIARLLTSAMDPTL